MIKPLVADNPNSVKKFKIWSHVVDLLKLLRHPKIVWEIVMLLHAVNQLQHAIISKSGMGCVTPSSNILSMI